MNLILCRINTHLAERERPTLLRQKHPPCWDRNTHLAETDVDGTQDAREAENFEVYSRNVFTTLTSTDITTAGIVNTTNRGRLEQVRCQKMLNSQKKFHFKEGIKLYLNASTKIKQKINLVHSWENNFQVVKTSKQKSLTFKNGVTSKFPRIVLQRNPYLYTPPTHLSAM